MLFTQRDRSPPAIPHAIQGLGVPVESPVLTCIAPSVLETHDNFSISPSALFSIQAPPSPPPISTFDPYFAGASTGISGDSKSFATEPFSPPPTGGSCPYVTPADYSALFANYPFPIDTGLPSRLSSPIAPTPSPTTSEAALLPAELLGASANTVTVGQILDSFSTQSLVDSGIGLSSRVKPFIGKLFHLLSHPESYRDVIVWDEQGLAFICHHGRRFTSEVLPQLFGHGNVSSFTRQLNVYGFTRLTASDLLARLDVASTQDYSGQSLSLPAPHCARSHPSEHPGWTHPQFRRDNGKGALHLLSPRPSRARLRKKAEKQRAQLQPAEDKAASGAGSKRPWVPPPPLVHAGGAVLRHPRTRRWSSSNESSDSSGESVAYVPSSTSSSVSTLKGGTHDPVFDGLDQG
ncbi:SPOSA6832_02708, partial [Sporobolomyces salmonicolor]